MDRVLTYRIATRMIGAALVVVALLPAGCGKGRRVETRIRDDGTTTHTLANNEIKVEGAVKYHAEFEQGNYSVEKRLILDARAVDNPAGKRAYELMLTYMGADALNMEPGRSLEIVADLNTYVLSAGGDTRKSRDPSGQYYTESLVYPVSADEMISMAGAATLRVTAKGRDGDARGYFDATNLADFRRFVAEYVRGQ